MAKERNIRCLEFSEAAVLDLLESGSRQSRYVARYLADLNAQSILHESKYFDRDYLAEFAAFYSVSSRPYPNTCERLHFFSETITRRSLAAAAGGSEAVSKKLKQSYLGFIVKRPIPAAPLGRTVLKWYDDDRKATTPRVTQPSREYKTHLAGIELSVEGLAWQQQDSGVGACATVSLWSMLHSSALDDHHAVPTTADITRDAHKRHSFGTRIFPSRGLNILQVYEAITEQDLVPLITEGDVQIEKKQTVGFSKERFASTCASFIRSGYPVLITGELKTNDGGGGDHAICCVGFRSNTPATVDPEKPELADSSIEQIYVHDDNLGPNVRFSLQNLKLHKKIDDKMIEVNVISIVPEAPDSARDVVGNSVTDGYGVFIPTQLVAAAHNDIRTAPDTLHQAAIRHASNIGELLNSAAEDAGKEKVGLTVSHRFIKLAEYLGKELQHRLDGERKRLSRVRLSLSERVDPMSLHIGVVRIGLEDSTTLVDILYDTTDSDRNHPVYASVVYSEIIFDIISILDRAGDAKFGTTIDAFS